MLGFGGSKPRRSKMTRLKSTNKRLDKKLAELKIEKSIKTKKKRLGISSY